MDTSISTFLFKFIKMFPCSALYISPVPIYIRRLEGKKAVTFVSPPVSPPETFTGNWNAGVNKRDYGGTLMKPQERRSR